MLYDRIIHNGSRPLTYTAQDAEDNIMCNQAYNPSPNYDAEAIDDRLPILKKLCQRIPPVLSVRNDQANQVFSLLLINFSNSGIKKPAGSPINTNGHQDTGKGAVRKTALRPGK